MLGQLNLAAKNKVQVAIDRLRMFEPKEGYYLAFSGGKDSLTIKTLADMAGVKYDAHYNITTADPPELVQYIKQYHKDVDMDSSGTSMWKLIPQKLMPPTRLVRYCCQELKERGGYNRMVITGVRWAESSRRKNNWTMVQPFTKSKPKGLANKELGQKIMLMNDNDERRRMTEQCVAKGKFNINPIIDWSDNDVWEFIYSNRLDYCSLYDEGFKRLGCVGCPMSCNKRFHLERWPKFKILYLRAFDRMLFKRKRRGKDTTWKTAQDVMDWWLSQ